MVKSIYYRVCSQEEKIRNLNFASKIQKSEGGAEETPTWAGGEDRGGDRETSLHAQPRAGGNRSGRGGKAVDVRSMRTPGGGSSYRARGHQGGAELFLLITFYVNAPMGVVVTKQVPINTISLLLFCMGTYCMYISSVCICAQN